MTFRQIIASHWLVMALCILLLVIGFILLVPVASEPGKYPKTINALQERYQDEVVAHARYNAYARQAEQEKYPAIAHLFRALAASEAIHARNFARLLTDLEVTPQQPTKPTGTVGKTKDNIRLATGVEANEIDHEYPDILERIKDEHHEEAIKFITWAWKAEEQHRKLIVKIHKASKSWFGALKEHIEGNPSRYYVCQVCGSTLQELPKDRCPIGDHPVTEYREVPGYPGPRKQTDENDF
jgi:rubrerythrin